MRPETIRRLGKAEQWQVRWTKQLPAGVTEKGKFFIAVDLTFANGKLSGLAIPASYFDDIMPAAVAGRAATDLTVPQNRLARAANDGDDGPLRGNYPAPGNLPL